MASSPIGREALIPNPALAPLEMLVGEWRATGTHPLVPGVTFHGRASFAWHEGGAFLVMRTEIDEPQIPSAVAIFGSDDAEGSFFMLYFDERGVSRKYDVTIEAGAVSWRRDDPTFSQRMTLKIDPGGEKIALQGVMSRERGEWEDDLSRTYTRASSSA
jgi:hypothetical protein